MSVQTTKSTTTYRTVKVAPEPVTSTVISSGSVSPMPYALNGNYETVRYLVPVQQAMPQQQSYVFMQQPMIQQQQPIMVSPVYLQNMSHLSVSSQESDMLIQRSAREVSLTFTSCAQKKTSSQP